MGQVTDPEPGEDYVEPTCPLCGRDMVLHSHWRKADEVERAELLEEGYAREYHRGGSCIDCQGPDVALPERRRKVKPGETIAGYRKYRAAGMTEMSEIAEKIGVRLSSLRKAVRAAGEEFP